MATVGNIDIDSENTVKFVVGVGEKVKVCAPGGYPPATMPVASDSEYKHLNGFTLLRPDIGDFVTPVPGNRCIYYEHKKSGQQIIRYDSTAIIEKTFYAILESITIHDHASVPQGGPAFATYFTEIADNRTPEGG